MRQNNTLRVLLPFIFACIDQVKLMESPMKLDRFRDRVMIWQE